MSDKLDVDSPYYEWASEILELVRTNHSFITMRVAEKLKSDLGDIVKAGFCSDCDYVRKYER